MVVFFLTTQECGNQCQWSSDLGALYSLQPFSDRVFQTSIQNLKGSLLRFSLCSPIPCDERQSPTCLNVPGVKLTSTGAAASLTPIEAHLPGRGFKLVLTDGDLCELTGNPRTTTFVFPCSPNSNHRAENFKPMRATEGTKESVCHYTVEFPASQFGCPVEGTSGDKPILTAGELSIVDHFFFYSFIYLPSLSAIFANKYSIIVCISFLQFVSVTFYFLFTSIHLPPPRSLFQFKVVLTPSLSTPPKTATTQPTPNSVSTASTSTSSVSRSPRIVSPPLAVADSSTSTTPCMSVPMSAETPSSYLSSPSTAP